LGGGPLCTIKLGISVVWRMHVGNKGSAVCRVGPEPALLEEAGQSGRLEIEIARMKKDGWQVKSDG